ncbi:MAG: M20/M25/M40 family metallo-hydrolase [Bacteroidetes bacterium]|nr:M20/M25/M40 family metallo-hydrolase [Bacteroidota bacterium]
MKKIFLSIFIIFCIQLSFAQKDSAIIKAIINEATYNSQLKNIAHELLDKIGPRLVGSPKMQQANDWAVAKYKSWGISAQNEKWGEWRGWERGITHVDMVLPWTKSLEATQLAWSPSTQGKTITADIILLPQINDSIAFQKWLPSAKGKIVMVSMPQPTGRPDYNWEEFGTKESVEKMKASRTAEAEAWKKNMNNIGYTTKTLPVALEKAGAVAIAGNNWSAGFGVDKIFGASTSKIPTIDIALEDYGLLYRLAEGGDIPKISIRADSRETGIQPTYNTIAEIKGNEKPNEYVMLSAHFDSWDGGTGATDNGTGTLVMMEAMRILNKVYPHPNRTLLAGHWGSEEQGLNGSRAFVEDHPEIIKNLQVLFNQDNGTGRIVNISGQGFLNSYEYITRWLSAVPKKYTSEIQTTFPGLPGGGGSDFASFVAAGAPAFSLSSNSWLYGIYTWHTNRDTYDKIVFDDVTTNVIITAIMAYMASEDAVKTSNTRAVLPLNSKTGQPSEWPEKKAPTRKGGMN